MDSWIYSPPLDWWTWEVPFYRKFYLFYLSIVLGSTPNEDSGIWWPCLKRKIRESGTRWAMGKIWDLTFYQFCAHFICIYIMQSFHRFLSRSLISLGRETWDKTWSLNNHRYNWSIEGSAIAPWKVPCTMAIAPVGALGQILHSPFMFSLFWILIK